jgi:hypothetical protein
VTGLFFTPHFSLSLPMQTLSLTTSAPQICGQETQIQQVTHSQQPVFLHQTNLKLENITAGFACALHMHQPTIPAGPGGDLISHLQYMFEHDGEGDNHNAHVFAQCYGRMGEFIPDLVAQGCNPRIMLDYSGNLLWGLQQMGRHDILDSLKNITTNPQYQPYVEWLGTMWSHAVAPSTPIADFKLQMLAWQHQFAAIFGEAALARVKGFSPPEMHLPNHPDTLFAYIQALRDCGYQWLMVQEHSVENLDGSGLSHEQKYLPQRLVARNSQGQTVSITALIKTQGSDTKLVAQMQPYFEAKTRGRQTLTTAAGQQVSLPTVVTQIADGENGGVMMNEFPRDFNRVYRDEMGGNQTSGTVAVNGTEYLELLGAAGVNDADFTPIQAIQQHKIWQRVKPETATPETVATAIADLQAQDHQFHLDGASWTNHISWVQGYENVLDPMYQLSRRFHEHFAPLLAKNPQLTQDRGYQEALLYNLLLQTSCFRYWGQGVWTDYARALAQRGQDLLR